MTTTFNRQDAEAYLKKLLKKHRIKVIKWSVTSSGVAWPKRREIKIPKPTNIDRFAICMHEVFHIISRKGSKSYEKEYYADMYARKILLEFGYDVTEWDKRTKWHVLSRVAMAHNRGLNHDKLNAEVRAFFPEIDFTKWYGHKVYVGRKYWETGDPEAIQFTPALTLIEINEQLDIRGLRMQKSQIDDSTYGHYMVYGPGYKSDGEFENLSEVIRHYKLSKSEQVA